MVFLQRGFVDVVKRKEKAGRRLVYFGKDDLFCLHNAVVMVTNLQSNAWTTIEKGGSGTRSANLKGRKSKGFHNR